MSQENTTNTSTSSDKLIAELDKIDKKQASGQINEPAAQIRRIDAIRKH